jgi:hypothetical protein
MVLFTPKTPQSATISLKRTQSDYNGSKRLRRAHTG